jgi:hypothetical protein
LSMAAEMLFAYIAVEATQSPRLNCVLGADVASDVFSGCGQTDSLCTPAAQQMVWDRASAMTRFHHAISAQSMPAGCRPNANVPKATTKHKMTILIVIVPFRCLPIVCRGQVALKARSLQSDTPDLHRLRQIVSQGTSPQLPTRPARALPTNAFEMGRLVSQIPNEDSARLSRVMDAKYRVIGVRGRLEVVGSCWQCALRSPLAQECPF